MADIKFRNRKAVQIEAGKVRVTVLVEGGHIAEIQHKPSGINPLWSPPWTSIDPSKYDPDKHPEYGGNAESRLLAGIAGHNVCLDLFGGPSDEEAAAGMNVHGEGSVVPYHIKAANSGLVAVAELPGARLKFERLIHISPLHNLVRISEKVENLAPWDRPIAWQQHVTLGPPFLERGVTELHAPATRSKVFEGAFGNTYQPAAEFEWPHAPRMDGGTSDLGVFTSETSSAGYTAHLMDPAQEQAFFIAFSRKRELLFGYVWKRSDFPWMGIWEENFSRANPPWNGQTMARGIEFGASPMPETRRSMIERATMFGVPCYRWIPAKSSVRVDYCAFIGTAASLPESVHWDGADNLRFSHAS
jgi:hypothetical protein